MIHMKINRYINTPVPHYYMLIYVYSQDLNNGNLIPHPLLITLFPPYERIQKGEEGGHSFTLDFNKSNKS